MALGTWQSVGMYERKEGRRIMEEREEAAGRSDEGDSRSCANCAVVACDDDGAGHVFPDFCLTKRTSGEVLDEALSLYRDDPETSRIFQAAAEIEGTYYGRLTRVEEIIVFARRIGARKIGIATCTGLLDESQAFAKILRAKGFEEVCAVACKVGKVDKAEAGIADEAKVHPGCFEPTCNPIVQAKILNEANTDLNVIVGLCVGHDTLFVKHAEAPVTYLIVKDRVLAHNPAAALYTRGSYYSRLMTPDLPEPRS